MLVLNIFVAFLFACIDFQVTSQSTYGTFEIRFVNVTGCKGPKSRDCGQNIFDVYKADDNSNRLKMIIDLRKDCPITQIRITNNALQPNGAKNLFNYNMASPCQHFFFGPTMKMLFNVTDNCILKKGKYTIDENVDAITRQFFGTKFFFGSFTFKTTAGNANENFSCTKFIMIFGPKI